MRLFAFVPILFTLMNAYIFWRLRSAFGPGRWMWVAGVFFLAMVTLFFFRRSVIGTPFETTAHSISLVWAGCVLISITWLLLLDGTRILAWVADCTAGTHLSHVLRPTRSVPVVLALCLGLCLYALYEAATVRPRVVTVPTPALPEGVNRLRIAVITDVHINALTGEWRLERIANIVRQGKPDVLVSLGDLTDTNMDNKTREAAILRGIKPPLGSYAVLGNHEFYSGLATAERFTANAGFTLLRNEAVEAGGIVLAGVDDPIFLARAVRATGDVSSTEEFERRFLRGLEPHREAGKFILFLRHRPGTFYREPGLFDMQLSGHTHGGQIWPARYFARRANENIRQGLSRFTDGTRETLVYVSNGTGFWGPPMRLFTPPEVTFVDLVRK